MMWRVLCFVLLMVQCAMLAAAYEEIPEFNAAELEQNWLQGLYDELEGTRLGVSVRSQVSNHSHWELGSLHLENKAWELYAHGLLPDDEVARANWQLAYQTPKEEKARLVLGSYRCAWGLGNVLSLPSAKANLLQISAPEHPSRYAFRGIAGDVEYKGFGIMTLASWQKRSVKLDEGSITRIASKVDPNLPDVGERILGLGLQQHLGGFSSGLLAYRQVYDRPFADSELQQSLNAFSATAGIRGKTLNLGSEMSWIAKESRISLEFEYTQPKFSQELGVSFVQGKQMTAFATHPALLGSNGEGQELRYELSAKPLPRWQLGFSSALARNNSAINKQNWKSRSIISTRLAFPETTLKLQLSMLDKELLVETDSSFSTSRPVHYRVLMELEHSLRKSMDYSLQIRYHDQEKLHAHDNGLWTQNALAWKGKILRVQGGFKIWHSLRTMIIPDAMGGNDEGYSSALGDDKRVFVKCNAHYKWLSMSMQGEQSWQNGKRSLSLNISSRLD